MYIHYITYPNKSKSNNLSYSNLHSQKVSHGNLLRKTAQIITEFLIDFIKRLPDFLLAFFISHWCNHNHITISR